MLRESKRIKAQIELTDAFEGLLDSRPEHPIDIGYISDHWAHPYKLWMLLYSRERLALVGGFKIDPANNA